MKCLEREQLFASAHGMLEPREEAGVRTHVADCRRCREIIEAYRKLDAALDEWKPAEPSAWFDARLRATLAVEGEGGIGRALTTLQWARWLVPAALLALVVFSIVLVRQSRRIPQPVARQEATRPVQPAPAPQAEQPAQVRSQSPSARQLQPPVTAQTKSPSAAPPQTTVMPEEDELSLYENLQVLEDYDLLANFEILSELPGGGKKVAN